MQMSFENGSSDELVMKLLRYFVTDMNYTPVIVHGVSNEIWLENLDENYKVVRIVSGYIHNDIQFESDIVKTKQLMKAIKRKTMSLNIRGLSIFTNLGDNVHLDKYEDVPNISMVFVKDEKDVFDNKILNSSFPNIADKVRLPEKGFDLFMKVTEEVSKKNEGVARMNEEVFSRKKPVITWCLIGINIVMYVLMYIFNLVGPFAVNRTGVLNGEFYRLFTGMFLHANIFHLVFNCYALYIIGMQLESFLGKGKYLAVYLLSGIAGSVLSIFMSNGYSIGASGAIFGLMGSLLYFGYHYRVYLETVVKSQIIPLILLNLMLGFMISGIDNWAHIGGLIGGVLATMALGIKYKSTKFEMVNGIILYVIYILAILFMTFNLNLFGN